jgi:hypothetical protein
MAIGDPELRTAVAAIWQARRTLRDAVEQCPSSVVRMFEGSIRSLDRLKPHLVALVRQAELLTCRLAATAPGQLCASLPLLQRRLESAGGSQAREQYLATRRVQERTLHAVQQLGEARAATIASLWRAAATIESVPVEMMWVSLLGDRAQGDPILLAETLLSEIENDTDALEAAASGLLRPSGDPSRGEAGRS